MPAGGDADPRLLKKARREVAAAVVMVLAAAAVLSCPFAMRHASAVRQQAMIAQSEIAVDNTQRRERRAMLDRARQYNGTLLKNGHSVDLGDDAAAGKDAEYRELLDAGDGVMGSIRIPRISVELPILHGSSQAALAQGAGHLYGTSLPVGGRGTHAVLTGHRGLPGATMFTRLDELRRGDVFYIEVFGKTLAYRVDSIRVILPTEGGRYLRIRKGEDRVTLMTCTPYGVNSHRLLVSGIRTPIRSAGPSRDPRPACIALAVGGAVLAVGVCAATRRERRMVARHARWRPF